MSIFNFFTKKTGREKLIDDLLEDAPWVRKTTLCGLIDLTAQSVEKLITVGRNQEANNKAADFLDYCYDVWKRDQGNPDYLTVLADASIRLGIPKQGFDILDKIVNDPKTQNTLDCTLVFCSMGGIFHKLAQIGEKQKKIEFGLYKLGIDAPPSRDGKSVATRFNKAHVHLFGRFTACFVEGLDAEKWHLNKAKALVPEIDFDNRATLSNFMQQSKWLHP